MYISFIKKLLHFSKIFKAWVYSFLLSFIYVGNFINLWKEDCIILFILEFNAVHGYTLNCYNNCITYHDLSPIEYHINISNSD